MAKMLVGGKRVSNLNLLYVAIWQLIHQGEFEYLKEIQPHTASHLVYRLNSTWSTAALCGLPNYNSIRVPTIVALWYCCVSPRLSLPPEADPLRFHAFNVDVMLSALKAAGVGMLEEDIIHINRVKGLLALLTHSKKEHLAKDELARALTYKKVTFGEDMAAKEDYFKELKHFFIEAPASAEQVQAELAAARVGYLSRA
jgi:hypothetical protein